MGGDTRKGSNLERKKMAARNNNHTEIRKDDEGNNKRIVYLESA